MLTLVLQVEKQYTILCKDNTHMQFMIQIIKRGAKIGAHINFILPGVNQLCCHRNL